jgi:hypothetical protein
LLRSRAQFVRVLWALVGATTLLVTNAAAQVTPAAPYTPPDDTPVIRVGATIFTDFTYTQNPEITDADGNLVSASAFNVARTYINVTGNISHFPAFRVTPDITRETGTGSSLNGSLTFRLKYGYLQVNLDDFMTRGSWARFGMQQTAIVDHTETIYRYRFQGTVFVDREGFLSSSDFGASFHYNFKNNYGDIHAGIYNGENYTRADPNDQKALQFRGTVRPFARSAPALRGLRLTGFYHGDAYVKNGERNRAVGQVTFEHKYLNAGFDYLDAKDQTSVRVASIHAKGYSVWVTPRSPRGFEGLIRYDHLKPNTEFDSRVRSRAIAGVAYWVPHQGNVSAAFLLDYEQVDQDNFTPAQPKQQRIALHALVNF